MSETARGKAAPTCAVAVMAKASIPGRVKTRLVPPLSPEEAARLNTAFLRDAADTLLAAARLANIKGFMAYAPAGSADFFRGILPDGVDLLETAATDLGGCLLQAATTLLDAGHASVCLLSSDNPTLPAGYLAAAASLLAEAGDRAVIGPSTDGGYYLIGIKRAHRRLFDNIAWSSEHVLRQTLARADELGVPIATLPAWYDVDDLDTLRVLVGELLDDTPFRATERDAAPAHFTHGCVRVLRETCAALAPQAGSHAGQR
jgi:uncharacterized protein